MGMRNPEVERIASRLPRLSAEQYRQALVEVLEEIAVSVDTALGVHDVDKTDEMRNNLGIAVEASYVAIEESIMAARNYIYAKKLHEKAGFVGQRFL
jgi:hypothetical protein